MGRASKAVADEGIDLCAHVQNLRDSIGHYHAKSMSGAGDESAKFGALARQYLLRYFYLIVFAEYLASRQGDGIRRESFQEWLNARREIRNLAAKCDRGEIF